MTARAERRHISIRKWHELAQGGAAPTMHIQLEGESMRPLIRQGRDWVTIVPMSRPPRAGDVVLFESPPGRYVVHRVMDVSDGRVRTLGDHCAQPDPWMASGCVLGLAVLAERGALRIPLDGAMARGLGRLWMALLPARRAYLRGRALAGRAMRRLGLRR